MDWSKAKTILIAALLITNAILGGFYLNQNYAEKATEESAAQNAVLYAKSKGILFETDLPDSVNKLPVVFVRFEAAAEPQVHLVRGLRVEAPDLPETEVIPEKEGDTSGKLIPVSEAILKFIGVLGGAASESLSVTDLQLVYMVYGSADQGAALEDTAVPAWKFTTSAGTYYVEAFAQ